MPLLLLLCVLPLIGLFAKEARADSHPNVNLPGEVFTSPHGAATLTLDKELKSAVLVAAARRYNALAREHGLTPAQLALAFCYRSWRVASTIIGVTTLAQLAQDLDAWSVTLSPELLAQIDAIRWTQRDPAQ